jgi:hypothetical protein
MKHLLAKSASPRSRLRDYAARPRHCLNLDDDDLRYRGWGVHVTLPTDGIAVGIANEVACC